MFFLKLIRHRKFSSFKDLDHAQCKSFKMNRPQTKGGVFITPTKGEGELGEGRVEKYITILYQRVFMFS
jgi:hypothetical protein